MGVRSDGTIVRLDRDGVEVTDDDRPKSIYFEGEDPSERRMPTRETLQAKFKWFTKTRVEADKRVQERRELAMAVELAPPHEVVGMFTDEVGFDGRRLTRWEVAERSSSSPNGEENQDGEDEDQEGDEEEETASTEMSRSVQSVEKASDRHLSLRFFSRFFGAAFSTKRKKVLPPNKQR
eukprot:gene34044-41983_t